MTDLQTANPDAAFLAKAPTKGRPRTHRSRVGSVIKHTVLVIASLIMIYPLLWMVVSSLRPNDEIFRDSSLLLTSFHWENWRNGWNALNQPFGHYIINSFLLVLGSVIGNLVSCSLAAYAFARLRFWGRNIFFALMLMTIMLPIHVIIVPQYILFSNAGLVNTFVPLLLPKFLATDAFFVFLMVQFIRGLPRELDEAARVDGCGHFSIFTKIILPLMLPALATATIFTFIWVWNDFFNSLIYLTEPDKFTVPLALRAFMDTQTNSDWGAMFAMSTLSLIPLFVVFLIGQRFLINGIATSGIK